jgi:hypothetical protein
VSARCSMQPFQQHLHRFAPGIVMLCQKAGEALWAEPGGGLGRWIPLSDAP